MLTWAKPGHEFEWCFNLFADNASDFRDEQGFFFDFYAEKLSTLLGEGFRVDNRGTRLEIYPTSGQVIDRSVSLVSDEVHQHVLAAVTEVFDNTELVVRELKPLPVTVRKCPKCGQDFTNFRDHAREAHNL